MGDITGLWLTYASVAMPAMIFWATLVWRQYAETRKVGGLRFVRIGRFGASFWISKRRAQ